MARITFDRKCEKCGTRFTTFYRNVTCSRACATTRKLEQMRQWRVDNPDYKKRASQ